MISGRYVKTFDAATHAMLDGANLNARYAWYWFKIDKIVGRTIFGVAAGSPITVKFRRTQSGDRGTVTVRDMIFGDLKFPIVPFKGVEK